MVVEEDVGDGDPLGSVGNIKKTIIVVLAVVKVGRKVEVIGPNILGCLNTDSITVLGQNLAALEVAENNVLDLVDEETNVLESRVAVQTDDGSVGRNSDLVITSDLARDVDDGRLLCSSSLGELGKSGDSSGSSTLATSGTPVGRGISNRARGNSSLVDNVMRSGNSQGSKRRQGEGRSELHFENRKSVRVKLNGK